MTSTRALSRIAEYFLLLLLGLSSSACIRSTPVALSAYSENGLICGLTIPLDVSDFLEPHIRLPVDGKVVNLVVDTGTNQNYIDLRGGKHTGPKIFDNIDFTPMKGKALLGTDFLSKFRVALVYKSPQPYITLSQEQCPHADMEKLEFSPISQRGFYSANPQQESLQLPVVYARIGQTTKPFPLIIDSGYSETAVPFGFGHIRINRALKKYLEDSGVQLIKKDRTPITITDCNGKSTSEEVFVAPQATLKITDETGRVIMPSYGITPIFTVLDDDHGCIGRVSSSKIPLGYVGAWYLMSWGVTVIDPFTQEVWLKSDPHEVLALAEGQDATHKWVWALGNSRFGNAAELALRSCKRKASRCFIPTILSPYGTACIAIVRSSRGPEHSISYATGPDTVSAKAAAMKDCLSGEQAHCQIDVVACNK